LQQQKEYWKQRGKIKYATLGDENTRFFHSTATIRHNKNSIMVLKDVNGVAMSKHEDKANILWEAFKERLGKSEFSHIYFDLDSLISGEPGLDDLQAPFTTEEIDAIVSNLPSGKSPGPDGFNTDFLKKCWNVTKPEFYELCNGFYNSNIYLQSINGSFIVLVSKVDNPSIVSDFRPISLLNSSLKLITKVLANMLQKVILRVIHQNQYGFLKCRSIQDYLAWSFEYLHLCHK
jgi:hypothetical protein